jgi:DNA-binding CsgD family transcriptional regulator/tetratricopeptide (TPR) repeat protein
VEAGSAVRSLILSGGPGIGKTTLWEAGVEHARERGAKVIDVRASLAEARLSFAALIDLCDCIPDEAFEALPPPQRAALEVALLRAEPGPAAPRPGAIALGFLNLLRELAGDGPVVVAIDDMQWLDAPSADALVFAARRLLREPVAFLLARRRGTTSRLESALERHELERLEVGPLGLDATRHLLADRLGMSVARPVLRRIVDSTTGNPLFALEVGRVLAERGAPPAGEDLPVPEAVGELLGSRVARLPVPVRKALLAVALSGQLRQTELAEVAGTDAVLDAFDAGLVRAQGDRVRAAHPLLAAAARNGSRPRERRELHRALAHAVSDSRLRALHLAVATDVPDEELADTVSHAACGAAKRGARQQAVLLAEHALRLTPAGSEARPKRLLLLARHLERTGEVQRITELLEPEIDSLPAGAWRARGLVLLSEGAGPQTVAEYEQHLDRALAECGCEPAVRSYVLAQKAALVAATSVSRLRSAEGWAQEALESGPADSDQERLALHALSWARALDGRPVDDLCERAGSLSDPSAYVNESPERVAGQRHVWRGEIEAGRALLTRLTELADERGELTSYALMRLHLSELELRTGEWESAARRLDEWAESAEGELLIRPMYQRCRALLAVGVGEQEEAERWAADAIARADAIGSRWDWLEAHRAQGIAALLGGEPARAADILSAAWLHTEQEQLGEPGVFPVAPELVEALVDAGRVEAARAVADRLHALAERHRSPWALAAARRSRALVELAAGWDNDAADMLVAVADEYERLGLGFDRARTLLWLGRAQRRLKQWGAARETLSAAAAAFAMLGSPGWEERTRADLARVGGRRPRARGELTPTERDVVELAAGGRANKEIARALHLAVHTVEVHLSRSYSKLGVRSRTQLAARLTGASSPG